MRQLLILIIFTTLFACKKNCTCSERSCPCDEVFFTFTANMDNGSLGQFTSGDLDELYMVQTSSSFQVLNSSKVFFNIEIADSTYNRRAFVEMEDFNGLDDFRNYNYLLKNKVLNTIDTLSSVSYNQKLTSRLCNTCSGDCPDEYVDCLIYSNY